MEKSNVLGGSNGSVAQVKVQHGIVEDHVIEDTQTPGKLGTLQRGLKSRHIQFIAIGGTVGTGLFVGSGGALVKSGPLSMLIGYSIVGTILWSVLQCVGEMATYLPIAGGLTVYAKRYVGDHLAFALGLNYWLGAAITLCAEVSAASIVIDFWNVKINPALWITVVLASVLALNIFSVRGYGEAEFVFASIKIVAILGLLFCSIIIDLGAGPQGHRLGFQYWRNPGPMNEYLAIGSTGRFLGVLATLVYATFAYTSGEVIAVAACKAVNPRRNIPRAIHRVFWRILVFYLGGIVSIGMLVSSRDPNLTEAIAEDRPGAGRSPFVIGIQNAGIKGLPSVINAVILTSAWSSGNAFLYAGSRNLYAMAVNNQVPQVFARCNRNGVPWVAVSATWAIGLLSYMNVSSSSSMVFGWFANLTTVCGLFNWISLSYTYIRFRRGCEVQNITALPFRAASPCCAYWALCSCTFILLVQGFQVFSGRFHLADFAAAYVGLLTFTVPLGLYIAFKGYHVVPYGSIDFVTGKDEVDEEERDAIVPEPRNVLEKIWFAIA